MKTALWLMKSVSACTLIALFLAPARAQSTAAATSQSQPTVCKDCIQKEVTYLASDELRGRGSATEDELTTAKHIAGVFQKLGLEPANGKDFIIPIELERRKFTAPPHLQFTVNGKETVWTHGKEMISPRLPKPEIKGKLFHAKADPAVAATVPEGAVVIISEQIPADQLRKIAIPFLLQSKAAALVIRPIGPYSENWDRVAAESASLPTIVNGELPEHLRVPVIAVKSDLIGALAQAPEGTEITITGAAQPDNVETRNVVALLRGSDPALKNQYVMFSAHMDHLGVCAKTGDTICNGADDDASGTATVLELARIFASGPKPKRSVVFTTFGSEELGLLGSRGFASKPPIPLTDLVADIEFEQTGLPEAKTGAKKFWMTGSKFSDLRTLLIQHGGALDDDPYPGSPFFAQSDNYSLAAKGVVAHTMSGAAEFPDYHKPGDEASKLNYDFIANALQAVLPGLEWLVNSDARPKYEPGKNPAEKK